MSGIFAEADVRQPQSTSGQIKLINKYEKQGVVQLPMCLLTSWLSSAPGFGVRDLKLLTGKIRQYHSGGQANTAVHVSRDSSLATVLRGMSSSTGEAIQEGQPANPGALQIPAWGKTSGEIGSAPTPLNPGISNTHTERELTGRGFPVYVAKLSSQVNSKTCRATETESPGWNGEKKQAGHISSYQQTG